MFVWLCWRNEHQSISKDINHHIWAAMRETARVYGMFIIRWFFSKLQSKSMDRKFIF